MACWLNGTIIPDDKTSNNAFISVFDRGFLLGDGVFDTLLLKDGQPQYFSYHQMRLRHNASKIGLRLPEKFDDLKDIISDLVNDSPYKNGYASLRTTITRGVGPRGLAPPKDCHPTFLVRVSQAPTVHEKVAFRCLISQKTKRNEYSILSQIKSLNYADSILAMMEAQDKNFDNAIMLNTQNHLTCASNGNIYAYKDGRWLTPPLNEGVLDGAIRHVLVQEKYVEQAIIHQDDLPNIQSMALSNSLLGLVPIQQCDDILFDINLVEIKFGNRQWMLEKQ